MSSAQVELEDEIPFELLETPTELEDLIDTFARLVFNITVIEEEMVVDRQMEYQYKGTEEIQGTQADKVLFEGEDQTKQPPMYFGLDNGEIIQAGINGEKMPGGMAEMMTEEFLQFVFLPFYYVEQIGLDELEKLPVEQINRSDGMIGELEVEIIEIHLHDMEIETEEGKELPNIYPSNTDSNNTRTQSFQPKTAGPV